MALFDFGVTARRELAEAQVEIKSLDACLQLEVDSGRRSEADATKFAYALDLIASSTAKAGSAIKLANIVREALGRPVRKRGEDE